jgi:hypothetical protein
VAQAALGVQSNRRHRRWLVALIAAAVLAVAGAVTVGVMTLTRSTGPTLADAQRECRTAFGTEFTERRSSVEGSSYTSSLLTSMTDIELQEARETDSGFEVNGVVHYDITSALLPTVHSSLSLTCEAREQDDNLVTTVRNRS